MTNEDAEIRMEHLPDDFLDDLKSMGSKDEESAAMGEAPAAVDMMPASARLEDVELNVIQKALQAHGGNVSAAARALGISRNTIYRKLG
jgi:sigma-54 dependent transcriptional regulator, acetoin dehydrogenase operon transcriptional activator AcoR